MTDIVLWRGSVCSVWLWYSWSNLLVFVRKRKLVVYFNNCNLAAMMLLFSVSHLLTDVGWSVIIAFAGNAPLPFQQSLYVVHTCNKYCVTWKAKYIFLVDLWACARPNQQFDYTHWEDVDTPSLRTYFAVYTMGVTKDKSLLLSPSMGGDPSCSGSLFGAKCWFCQLMLQKKMTSLILTVPPTICNRWYFRRFLRSGLKAPAEPSCQLT